MARIRTIKPEFFRHLELYEAEIETKLPLRVAYAGLWTASDKEGRFKWKPEELKLDCLPFDVVDFSRVLDALWTRQFIEKYEFENKIYGFIPSWNEHQHINNRESESILPNPYESNILTREGRVLDASEKLPRGRERKGKEGKDIDASVLMKNSPCNDYKFLIDNIGEDYLKYDLAHYHKSLLNWSNSKGAKRMDWVAVIRGAILRDDKKGEAKLKTVDTLQFQPVAR